MQVGPEERRRVSRSALLRPRRDRAHGDRRQRDPGFPEPHQLAGGAVKLNPARAHEVFESRIARPMAFPSRGRLRRHVIAASNMMRAIRAVSSERGRDPREYALFAFGGNGPLFAAGMARQLEMRHVVVPPAPGLFSSFGLLFADVEHHYVRTGVGWFVGCRQRSWPRPFGGWRRRRAPSSQQKASRVTPPAFAARLTAATRANRSSSPFPSPRAPSVPQTVAGIEEAFGREHERTYGHRAGPDEPVEIVSLRVVGLGLPDRPRVPDALTRGSLRTRPRRRRPPRRTSVPTSAGARPRSSTGPTWRRRARGRASSRSTIRPA